MISMKTIIQDPTPSLREKCSPVLLPLSKQDSDLLDEMIKYVEDSRQPELAEKYDLQPAVGIAAPQVGVNKRMCVVMVDQEHDEGEPIVTDKFALVNPVIISQSQKLCALKDGEGCLSIQQPHPGLVYRPLRIKVKAYDYISKQNVVINAEGYLAIVIQHEIDHLNGVLFYDHINANNPWRELPNAELL